jgi:hypothetical protein
MKYVEFKGTSGLCTLFETLFYCNTRSAILSMENQISGSHSSEYEDAAS